MQGKSSGRGLRHLASSVVFIAVVALVLRIGFVCFYFAPPAQQQAANNLPFGYEAGAVAAAIAQGSGFSSPLKTIKSGPTAWFTPIYPYLLASVFKVFGVYSHLSSVVIRCVDDLFSAWTCWPIYTIGAKAFSKRTGAAAAWIWVFSPASLFFSTVWVWDTALSALMLALVVATTLELRGSERLRSWIGYGALWALASMVNPAVISILPPLALWALWPLRRRFATAGRLVLAGSLIFVAGITPWTIRNFAVFHKVIPFRSNFGLELWLGNNPLVPQIWAPNLHPNEDASEAAKYAQMTEIPYMQEKQREAVQFIRAHPLDTLDRTLHRFSNFWIAGDEPSLELWRRLPGGTNLAVAANCIFPALSLLGVLFAYREENEAAVPLASVMLFFPLIFYITHSSSRYRHPIDPVMLVLAVYALAYPVTHLLKRFSGLYARIPATNTTD
jgi:4-amino-4-deoxy-L-arabinose transferase-like glycosyltransferase